MKLNKKDCAVIFRADGSTEVRFPKSENFESGEPVSDAAMSAAALAILVTEKDKELFALIRKRTDELAEEAKSL